MMEKQSLDFIAGYVFGKVEDSIKSAHVNKLAVISPVIVYVPKLWFGLRPIKDKSETLGLRARLEMECNVNKLCSSYNTRHTAYSFCTYARPDEQYISFIITGTLIPPEKEMTVAEIEEKLGYKIKIVSEH